MFGAVRTAWLLAVFGLLAVFARPVHADLPAIQTGLVTTEGPLPLVHAEVQARVVGPLVEVVVRQTFRNPGKSAVEAVYLQPLPLDAVVSALTIKSGEKVIVGEVRLRADARAAYEAAVKAGVVSSLLESDRPDVFSQSVTGIAAGATVDIELRWDTTARALAGEWELRVPMVIAPRVVPGTPTGAPVVGSGGSADTDRAPDASRVTPVVAVGAGGVSMGFHVTLDGATGIYSPTNALSAKTTGKTTEVTIAVPRMDRDVSVRWKMATSGWIEVDGSRGVVATLLERPIPATRVPVQLLVVVDGSATLTAAGRAQQRRVVNALVSQLGANDKVAMVGGARDAQLAWRVGGSAVDEATWKKMEAASSQDLTAILGRAAELVARAPGKTPLAVVLISDGLIADDRAATLAAARLGSPVLPVSVGPAPNHGLLHAIAVETNGSVRSMLDGDDATAVARALLADAGLGVAAPTLAFASPAPVDQVPSVIPMVGAGQAVVVLARLPRGKVSSATVDGAVLGFAATRKGLSTSSQLTTSGLLTRRWGAARLASGGVSARDIATLAMAHGLVSTETSLIAVGTEVLVEGGVRRSVTIPVAAPAGMAWGSIVAKVATTDLAEPASVDDDLADGVSVTQSGDGRRPESEQAATGAPAPISARSDDRDVLRDADATSSVSTLGGNLDLALSAGVGGGRLGERNVGVSSLAVRLVARHHRLGVGVGAALWLSYAPEQAGLADDVAVAVRPTVDLSLALGSELELGASLGAHLSSEQAGLAWGLALRAFRYQIGSGFMSAGLSFGGVVARTDGQFVNGAVLQLGVEFTF